MVNILNGIGEGFFYSIILTPIISYFIVMNLKDNRKWKIIKGVGITILLASVFLLISLMLMFHNGIGIN